MAPVLHGRAPALSRLNGSHQNLMNLFEEGNNHDASLNPPFFFSADSHVGIVKMFELSKLGRFQLINAIWRIFPFQRHLATEWKETRIEWPTRPRINNSGASFRVIVGPYITSRRSVSCWRHLAARRIFFSFAPRPRQLFIQSGRDAFEDLGSCGAELNGKTVER